ncbi:hypothetical protein EXN00_09160 [Clostridium botulinum]|uniref:Uncharacterized protein n=3 Tax=Clostridium botulinum TaxID=1491 RepID=C1FR79_CLOBJ|nr:hypothetical protein [Clostridium botulinum]ACO85095.1 conserved hypothetical protein [Clostridium botulinum A2 str. Kyoto]EKN42497.1 hypothetical protein CFSAN001627_06339 [Clostridium botulinum CFSAN001627]NFL76742.1 hypothetical protein [Clostridium sporogenes]AUM88289.1 hypothetical protein RSJ15_11485 [Clostridium botulinum]AUN07408.1 hypothetical protein RSJ14_12160 [Clostridium botulinum]
MYSKHNICPHDFYNVQINDMARRLILAFTDYEIEEEKKIAEQARKGAR